MDTELISKLCQLRSLMFEKNCDKKDMEPISKVIDIIHMLDREK